MSKKPKTYNLDFDVTKEISKRARDDGRKDSDWLNRYLTRQFKLNAKPKKQLIPAEPVEVVGFIPCAKGESFELTRLMVDTWSKAYPSVDVAFEINKIVAWLESNPTKKKTLTGCKRFINSWLGRCQDKGGSSALKQEEKPIDDWHLQNQGF